MSYTSWDREFRGVRKNTSFPGLFETTGKIILTRKANTIRLLQILAYHCPKIGMPKITWGKRSWAKWRTRHINFENPNELNLTVHIVLHEYAHLMAKSRREEGQKRRQIHGPTFRLCLDAIMLVWRDKIRANFIT